jgi:pteridine reductase
MKIALITGAALRIGRGIAECMLKNDFHLILHANSSLTELRRWVSENKLASRVIANVGADLSNALGQDYLCREVEKLTDHLDVIVHNASLYKPQKFETISRESYVSMQGVNLDAPFFITQALLPLLKRSQNPSVIHIIDALWERPSPKFSHYSVGKAGLAILTKVLARELAPTIRVNAVAPGAILFQPFHTEKIRSETLKKIPLSALGTVSDIGNAVVFLADSAPYMTGEILVIDGGRSLA